MGKVDLGPVVGQQVGQNILDNWCFVDPINQQNGYIVNSGVTYYKNSSLTTSAGTTTATMTAKYVNSTYGTVDIDGTTYYVAASDLVRGYVSAGVGYAIDRWLFITGGSILTLRDNGIHFANTSGHGDVYLAEKLSLDQFEIGQQYTLSALFTAGSSTKCVEAVCYVPEGPGYVVFDGNAVPTNGISQVSFSIPTNVIGVELRLNTGPYGTVGEFAAKAAKLELGSQQTLAHQDAAGNWVLNDPPPNKAMELAKCQRYQNSIIDGSSNYVYAGTGFAASSTKGYIFVPLPVTLRANPSVVFSGTIALVSTSVKGTVTAIELDKMSSNGVTLKVIVSGELTPGEILSLQSRTEDARIFLDANL